MCRGHAEKEALRTTFEVKPLGADLLPLSIAKPYPPQNKPISHRECLIMTRKFNRESSTEAQILCFAKTPAGFGVHDVRDALSVPVDIPTTPFEKQLEDRFQNEA